MRHDRSARRRENNREAIGLLARIVAEWPGPLNAPELVAATRHLADARTDRPATANEWGETFVATHALVSTWPEHSRGSLYFEALGTLRASCRSCGDRGRLRGQLCVEPDAGDACWAAFRTTKAARPSAA